MNVLSLFGGIETGLIALKELGIKIDNYYSSEIDKYAIAVAKYNHPEIQHLGSIEDYESWELPMIDLILAGPPCQGFSIAGKGLNWDDTRSQLFFKAIEILWRYEPKYFLFENVASMKKEIVKEIDELMEVNSVMINSALVSAQNRKRNFWSNLKIEQPADKGILLKNVIENNFVDRDKSHCIDANYYKGGNLKSYFEKNRRQLVFTDKSQTIPATIYKENAKSMVKRNKKGLLVYVGALENGRRLDDGKSLSRNFREGYRIYSDKGKSVTLTAQSKGGPGGYSGLYEINGCGYRKLTPVECERLQTLPDNYTLKGTGDNGKTVNISNTQRYKMVGNGWTKDVIKHILKGINEIRKMPDL